MMEKELMSEIKVMDMVWNCKFFGTPLLFMDIMVIDDCSSN
ncbi:Os04g0379500 [Oryza sativa Japonica Group]|uniref:Os04g0379500 protein n=1 Tax=Oryza sativa subsp. japonica TaxID=39947 RepID=C7J0W4_ORYSJ|nr:Os04g0379500 [Oryza sativa Japonica Group]|eukprot:NP_001173903.1 Os04g0379500 [Oryza sativa Japonica Group]